MEFPQAIASEAPLIKAFKELTNQELYAILQARNEVFVVGQNCVYQDTDGYDNGATHIIIPYDGRIGAYCRILPPDLKYKEWAIGRVLTAPHARGKKLAHQLTQLALSTIVKQGGKDVRISAQAYLQKFYETHGFIREGAEYLEDNIPHIEMYKNLC